MKNTKKIYKNILIMFLIFFILLNTNIYALNIEKNDKFIWPEEVKDEVLEPKLSSKYIVCLDRNSKKKLYCKNENEKVPMASTTKIMTAIILMENLETNSDLNLNKEVIVSKEATLVHGSKLGLKAGDKITINDLLYGLMLCSRK